MKQLMNYKEIYCQACEFLEDSENASFEAMELITHVFGVSRNDILLARSCDNQEKITMLFSLLQKRRAGYPLQYIIGEWDFFGLSFLVGEGVLIPRADTETLVEVVLNIAEQKEQPLKILDICSGSGCIAIALKKHLPWANVFALEKSEQAIFYLRKNLDKNQTQISVLKDDALNPQTQETDFDIIVSNPPYLTKKDMENLQKEVSFEPSMALYGDDDGLLFYRRLTEIWSTRLKKEGMLAYEIGIHQEKAVGEFLNQQGFVDICNAKDLCGIIRAVYGFLP